MGQVVAPPLLSMAIGLRWWRCPCASKANIVNTITIRAASPRSPTRVRPTQVELANSIDKTEPPIGTNGRRANKLRRASRLARAAGKARVCL